jgi:hypothetical protein
LKFANLGTMLPISCSSMGGKNILNEQHGGHGGLFIYLNNKYVGFFHDVTILHKLNLYKNSHYIYIYIYIYDYYAHLLRTYITNFQYLKFQ